MWRYKSTSSELYHSGVLGMKWGRRKILSDAQRKPSTKGTYDEWDKQNYGKRGQARIEAQVLAGKSKAVVRGKELVKSQLIGWATVAVLADVHSGGAIHRSAGKAFVTSYLKSKAAKATMNSIVKIAQNKKFNPIDVAFKVMN